MFRYVHLNYHKKVENEGKYSLYFIIILIPIQIVPNLLPLNEHELELGQFKIHMRVKSLILSMFQRQIKTKEPFK